MPSCHYSLLIYFSIKTPDLSDKPYKFPPRAKPAPPVFEFTGAIGQHSPISSPFVMSPHPLQNRVPRVQVLLPLPIRLFPGLAKTAWSGAFSYLCCPGHGLLNSVLCCICCCPPTSGRNWFLPLFSPPAPKTHPVSPFSDDFGCVSLFLSSFDPQNFPAVFYVSCLIVATN